MAGIMYEGEKEQTVIRRAILNNDLVGLKSALEAGEDPHKKDRKGNTYLHYLCTMNRPYLIHVLIGTHIDLNAVNRHGNTALHVTALQSECCHVGDLMAAGIDATIRNKDRKIAAEIPTKNQFWKTVFEKYDPGIFEAIDQHDVEKVLYLLNCWSRVDTIRDGLTLRQFAACRKFHDLVFHIDLHQHTLNAIYAVLEGNPDKAWPFLSHNKCNVNLLNVASSSKHILQEAIKLADIRLVRMICRSKVNPNVRVTLSNFLKAPLFFSVLNPKVGSDIRWTVLRSGCDFALRDERGRNAAVYALDRFKGDVPYDIITFMMKNKLDVAQRDATGVTLRDVTRFYRRKDILTLLDKAYVKVLRTSNIPELERLCCSGYDSLLINFNYRDTFIYASGNDSEDVLNFVQWIPLFCAQVRRLFHCIRYKSLDDVSQAIENCRKPQMLINARDKGGRSPQHIAILHWRFDVLKLLMKMPGTDWDAQDNCGKTALHYACCVEDEDERTEFCAILSQAGVDQETLDFTGRKASDYLLDVRGHRWWDKERKTRYGTPKQLACVDKYEELYRMMKGKGKTLRHFNDAVKRFKQPVPQLYTILSPVMPKYRDLVHAAMDHGKEDIAVRLVQLGNSLSVRAKVTVTTIDSETSSKTKEIKMSVLERARHLGMEDLVTAIENRIKHEQVKMLESESRKDGEQDIMTQETENGNSTSDRRVYKVRKLNSTEDESGDVLFEEEVADDDSESESDESEFEVGDDDREDKVNEDKKNLSISDDAYSDSFDDDDYSDDNDDDDKDDDYNDGHIDSWE